MGAQHEKMSPPEGKKPRDPHMVSLVPTAYRPGAKIVSNARPPPDKVGGGLEANRFQSSGSLDGRSVWISITKQVGPLWGLSRNSMISVLTRGVMGGRRNMGNQTHETTRKRWSFAWIARNCACVPLASLWERRSARPAPCCSGSTHTCLIDIGTKMGV